jgi:hypothetical protein
MASAALNYALNNGISQEQYYKNIFDYVNSNRGSNDVQLRAEMDRLGVSSEDVAKATGVPLAGVQTRYNVADEGAGRYIAPANIPASVGLTYGLNNNMTQAQIDKNIFDFVNANRGLNDVQLAAEMDRLGISPNDVARATGVTYESVAARYNAAKTGKVGGTGNTAITDVFNQYVTPTGKVTPVTPTTPTPTATVGLTPITTPNTTAGQMRELFPSFAESKRLAGEMVAKRPTTASIVNLIRGGTTPPSNLMDAWSAAESSGDYGAVANLLKGLTVNDLRNYGASASDIAYITSRPQIAPMFPTVRPAATVTPPSGLMSAWKTAETSGNYGDVANMLRGLTTADLRNYGASVSDIDYITSRPQISGVFQTGTPAAAPSLNNVLSMISK